MPLRPRRPGLRGADHARRSRPTGPTPRCSRRPGSCTCWPASRTTRPARRRWSTSATCPCGRASAEFLRTYYEDGPRRVRLPQRPRPARSRWSAASTPGRPRSPAPTPAARWSRSAAGIDSIVTVDEVLAHGGATSRPRPVRREPRRRPLRGHRGAPPPSPGCRWCGPSGRSIPRSCARPSSGSSTATCRSPGSSPPSPCSRRWPTGATPW